MIDWERTEQETGFGKEYFEKYPGSEKKVWVICDGCKEKRCVKFIYRSNNDLCKSCSARKGINKYYKDNPNHIEKCGENNPIEDISNKSIDWIKTKKETGFGIEYFEKRSGTHKIVWAICKVCGIGRWSEFRQYRDLCVTCKNGLNLPVDKIIIEYKNGMSTIKLAKKYNCDHHAIRDKLIQNNVKLRSISESLSEHYKDPEACERQSARVQGIPYDEWEGFAKDKLYCPKFNEACRESNRAKYERRCFLSDLPEEKNITSTGKQRKLSVHHTDMDKGQGCDGARWRLVPICMKYHGKAHSEPWKSRIIWLLENVWDNDEFRAPPGDHNLYIG